jgi:3-deoxy-D-manno-octulosonate 8-phosphate phosphatase (KDO 8-P phosphatase)
MTDNDLLQIRMIIMDVDGVLTDGGIIVHSDGTESKRFHVIDGHRIKMWQRADGQTAIISGRDSQATTKRAEQLGIPYVMQGCLEKLPAFESLLEQTGLRPEQAAYIGDDLMDIPLVRRAGLGVAVANADDELKKYADVVTVRGGGNGAVGEVIEYLLKASRKWDALMERYLV